MTDESVVRRMVTVVLIILTAIFFSLEIYVQEQRIAALERENQNIYRLIQTNSNSISSLADASRTTSSTIMVIDGMIRSLAGLKK